MSFSNIVRRNIFVTRSGFSNITLPCLDDLYLDIIKDIKIVSLNITQSYVTNLVR